MKYFNFATLFLFITLLQTPALADTDYRCLNNCVRDGKTSGTCMSQCSYNVKPSPPASDSLAIGASHNIFKAPTPLTDNSILPEKPGSAKIPVKDYKCIAECHHDGLQFDLCEQKCIKPEASQAVPKTIK